MAGEVNVDAMLRRITAKQFRDWQTYYELEPFGEMRADYRSAQVAQMLFNVNRGSKEKARPLADFLLKFEPEEERPKQNWQEQFAIIKTVAKVHATPEQLARLEAMADVKAPTGPIQWPKVIEEGTVH